MTTENKKKGTYPNIRVSLEAYTPKGSTDVVTYPHAQLKGNVTRDTEVRPASEGKKAFIAFSMGINYPVMKLWDLANHKPVKDKQYDESQVFLQVVAYDNMAERFTKIHENYNGVLKGDQLDVSGKLSLENFERNDGTSGQSVRLTLDRFEIKPKYNANTQSNSSSEEETASDEEIEAALAELGDEDDEDIPF